jgi:predicted dehydrogenase
MSDAGTRLALIGAGAWGRNYIRTIQSLSDVNLVALATRNSENAAFVPPGCHIVADWREVFEATDIEGVIVATPPDSHAEILIAAVQAKTPVLIEKPLVKSREEAALVRQCLYGRPATILVDHIHLFHPAFQLLQSLSSSLGPIRSIVSAAGNRDSLRGDVSVLWDWAPHDIAMCLTLLPGLARPIRAERLDVKWFDGAAAETIAIGIELAGGVTADIRLSTLEKRHRWFSVRFDSCTLVYRDTGPVYLTRLRPDEDVHAPGEPIVVRYEQPLTRAVLEFAEAIRLKEVNRTDIDLGLAVVELIADIEDILGKP